MKKLLLILTLSTFLGGCGFLHPYRPDIQQGNIVNPQKMSQLRVGMLREQVITLLGDPVLTNTFDNDQLLYVYNFIPNRGQPINKRLILTFKQDQLTRIEK